MQVRFDVEGVPPKKDGASSMWSKRSELQRLRNLRRAAGTAMSRPIPITARATLRLKIYAAIRAGDLDNFITGVCDGLMAAHPRTPPAIAWQDLPREIWPDKAVGLVDDSCVQRIEAERVTPGEEGPRYEIELSWD